MPGPLSGIKVLDLSRILAGPWATQQLADFGATVWKIEHPEGGDDTRHWGPPFLKDKNGEVTEESAYFLSANRGKHSLALDISKPEGQAIVRRLVSRADVLVENFKVGALKKYGLDYPTLSAINPRLIYCSITGFGQTGPYANQAGYDAMIQATGGLMSITGERDGMPGAGPQKVGVAVADLMAGMYAGTAILAALYYRERTGKGQYIDLALLDSQVAWLANQGMNYLVGGEVPHRHGTAHPNIVPYQALPCADGYLMLAVGNNRQFQRCCELLGIPECAQDVRFSTNAARVTHRDELIQKLSGVFSLHPCAYWLDLLVKNDIPCGPINTIDKVFAHEQVRYRGMQVRLDHPLAGSVPQIGNPVKFSESAVSYKRPPPMLGQDTDRVLQDELAMSAEEIAVLREAGLIN